jgi:DnaJ-class molecular chaperone
MAAEQPASAAGDDRSATAGDRAAAAAAEDRAACTVCRGTGRVTSMLGGTASQLECPWCEGTGRFIAEHDAQEARRAGAG